MEDLKIVELYRNRDEKAIYETQLKYGHYCYSIAYNILHNNEDSQECVNDTYLRTWESIPPHNPSVLSTFLGKITRRLSLNRWRELTADKRGGGEFAVSLDELGDCIGRDQVAEETNLQELTDALNRFLSMLKESERKVFVCRYWYSESIEEICRRFGYSESKTKMMLKRTRDHLKEYLEKEGIRV